MTKSFAFAEREYGAWRIDKVRTIMTPIPGAGVILKPFARKHLDAPIAHSSTEFAIRNPLTNERRILKLDKEQTLKAEFTSGGALSNPKSTALQVSTAGRNVSVGEYIAKNRVFHERHMGVKMDRYSLALANCQMFTSSGLKAAGFDYNPETAALVDQHAPDLVPKWASGTLDKVTDAARWYSDTVANRNYAPPHAAHRKNNAVAIGLAQRQATVNTDPRAAVTSTAHHHQSVMAAAPHSGITEVGVYA